MKSSGRASRIDSGLPTVVQALLLVCALTSSGRLRAEAFQTDAARTPLPQPVGMMELSLGDSWGYVTPTASFNDPITGERTSTPILYGEYYSPPAFPQFEDGDAFTFQGLFKWRGEAIDPIADASSELGHFFPGCELKAELVLHGGDCDVALGWYNYTADLPPAPADIQVLVPKGSTYLNAKRGNLVPLAWGNLNPRDLSQTLWTPQVFSSGDIVTNSRYLGGEIAFVMLSDSAHGCPADKFSVYQHNQRNAAGVPWVTALTYRSKVDPSAVYLAFEDLPMSPEDWRNGGLHWTNDGDFNDAVFFVSGLGSGASCPDLPEIDGAGGAGGSGAEATGGTAAAGAAAATSAGAGTDDASAAGGAPHQTPAGDMPSSGGSLDDDHAGEPNGGNGVALEHDGNGTAGRDEPPSCACRLAATGTPAPPLALLALALAAACSRRRRSSSRRA